MDLDKEKSDGLRWLVFISEYNLMQLQQRFQSFFNCCTVTNRNLKVLPMFCWDDAALVVCSLFPVYFITSPESICLSHLVSLRVPLQVTPSRPLGMEQMWECGSPCPPSRPPPPQPPPTRGTASATPTPSTTTSTQTPASTTSVATYRSETHTEASFRFRVMTVFGGSRVPGSPGQI